MKLRANTPHHGESKPTRMGGLMAGAHLVSGKGRACVERWRLMAAIRAEAERAAWVNLTRTKVGQPLFPNLPTPHGLKSSGQTDTFHVEPTR